MNCASAGFDWVSVVIIPTFMTIALGGPFAVWLTHVTNRQATFREVKTSSIRQIALLKKETLEADWATLLIRIYWVLESEIIAFGAEEQWDAMNHLLEVRKDVRARLRKEFDRHVEELGVQPKNLSRRDMINMQDEVFQKCAADIRRWIFAIEDLRPDGLRILGLIPRNRTLARWEKQPVLRCLVPLFDLLRTRNARWKKFQEYIEGKSEEPL